MSIRFTTQSKISKSNNAFQNFLSLQMSFTGKLIIVSHL